MSTPENKNEPINTMQPLWPQPPVWESCCWVYQIPKPGFGWFLIDEEGNGYFAETEAQKKSIQARVCTQKLRTPQQVVDALKKSQQQPTQTPSKNTGPK